MTRAKTVKLTPSDPYYRKVGALTEDVAKLEQDLLKAAAKLRASKFRAHDLKRVIRGLRQRVRRFEGVPANDRKLDPSSSKKEKERDSGAIQEAPVLAKLPSMLSPGKVGGAAVTVAGPRPVVSNAVGPPASTVPS
eukprot:TRINITY_DN5239_c0_g1_i1.p1 TRINITY_DN5239_c0_g1~~TRINITY_DN5239_c0_g1_i1.p1  ORF type:complete len:136 (-),score=16.57 TRINITY_DN5239_c0_g1_i1:48-455(-)